MRNIPVLLEGFTLMTGMEAPSMKMVEEKGKPSVPAVDKRTGQTLYTVTLMVMGPVDGATGRRPKPTVITVTLECDPGDTVGMGMLVELVDPRVSFWEKDDRSGLAWRAQAIVPATADRAAA
jgi:hypothetical protein